MTNRVQLSADKHRPKNQSGTPFPEDDRVQDDKADARLAYAFIQLAAHVSAISISSRLPIFHR